MATTATIYRASGGVYRTTTYEGAVPYSASYRRRNIYGLPAGEVAIRTSFKSTYYYSSASTPVRYDQYRLANGNLVNVFGAFNKDPNTGVGGGSSHTVVGRIDDSSYGFAGWFLRKGSGANLVTSKITKSGVKIPRDDAPAEDWLTLNGVYLNADGNLVIKYDTDFDESQWNGLKEIVAVAGKVCTITYRSQVNSGTSPGTLTTQKVFLGTGGYTATAIIDPAKNGYLPPSIGGGLYADAYFAGWGYNLDESTGEYEKVFAVGESVHYVGFDGKTAVSLYAIWKPRSSLYIADYNKSAIALTVTGPDGIAVSPSGHDAEMGDRYPISTGLPYAISCEGLVEGLVHSASLVGTLSSTGQPITPVSLPGTLTIPFTQGGDGDTLIGRIEITLNTLHSISVECSESKGNVSISPSAQFNGKWLDGVLTFVITSFPGFRASTCTVTGVQDDIPIPDDGIVTVDVSDLGASIVFRVNFEEAANVVSASVDRSCRHMGTASCTPSGSVPAGTTVMFTAVPADDAVFQFDEWVTPSGEGVSEDNPHLETVADSNIALVARFSAIGGDADKTLTVRIGEGSEGMGYVSVGKLDATPSGGEHGQTSLAYTAANGSAVIVQAFAANGHRFIGWFAPDSDEPVSTLGRISTYVSQRTLEARFAVGGGVLEWEGAQTNKTATWKSKVYESPRPFNPSAVRVDVTDARGKTKGVRSVTVGMMSSPDGENTAVSTLVDTVNHRARRLPFRRMERYLQVEVSHDSEIDRILVGTSMGGLAI